MARFENVGLRYGLGPEVLRDVTFSLESGSFHFLVGESGAGKSSLLKLLYLALKPSRGLISLFGADIATTPRPQLPALRRQIGVVFQEFRLLEHLSAFDNVALPLRVAGIKEADVNRHVTELLEWVGLKDHMKSRPPTLSGGQQQRVSIARAVIARPKLLLADEPTGNVDDRMALRLMHLFEELNRLGTTIVVATHNMALVDGLGYPILRLDAGTLATVAGSGNKSAAREWRESRESAEQQARAQARARRERRRGETDEQDADPPGIENFL
ncbi:MAG: cell division ATP-binding protein FtsE [Rhodospirillales bacterium]|nr:cell division ATP-binding protein FtsE [Rhodospirillales bacterium]